MSAEMPMNAAFLLFFCLFLDTFGLQLMWGVRL